MTGTVKRIISIVSALLVLGLAFFLSGKLKDQKQAPPKAKKTTTLRTAYLQSAAGQELPLSIELQGRLVPVEEVPLFAEVTGVFEASDKAFKLGVFYPKGSVLARLNNQEEVYRLQAQRAALANSLAQAMPDLKIDYPKTAAEWDHYLKVLNPQEPLAPLPAVDEPAAKYLLNARNIYNQYYNIKAAEERLRKYTLRAPVGGTLTQVNATVGSLVRQNQQIGTLTANRYEMAATIPVSELTYLPLGTAASLVGPNGQSYSAKVVRISSQVDPTTQSATVYLQVSGKGLREGLYLKGSAEGAALQNVVALPQSLLLGTNEVFAVKDSVLVMQEVDILRRDGDELFISALSPDVKLLAKPLSNAYEGMKVNPVLMESASLSASAMEDAATNELN